MRRLNLYGPIFSILLLLALAPISRAANIPPEVLVKNVTNEVLSILRQDKEIQAGETTSAIELIETKVAPHFDFKRMTALALGRHWQDAGPSQQEALTQEFHKLLVRTYANALMAYNDQTVVFKPSRQEPTATEVTVRSQINQPGARPVTLEYSLAQAGGDTWKVYDVTIDSVSLVTNYRTNFSKEIQEKGIDGLIKSLQAKNRSSSDARLSRN